jgi:hypothetical protein
LNGLQSIGEANALADDTIRVKLELVMTFLAEAFFWPRITKATIFVYFWQILREILSYGTGRLFTPLNACPMEYLSC